MMNDYKQNVYPHKFHVSISIPEYVQKYNHLKNEEKMEKEIVSVSGIVDFKTTVYDYLILFIPTLKVVSVASEKQARAWCSLI